MFGCAVQIQNAGSTIDVVAENGTSVAVFFTEHGIPASIFRPKGGNPHQKGEWVDMNSVIHCTVYWVSFFEYKIC